MELIEEYYSNGLLKSTGYLKNGFKQGRWIFYFEDGNKYREIDFANNIENGIWKMWHKNGNLYIVQNMKFGRSDGIWKEYYENGNLKETGEYRDGKYFPNNFWDENGKQLMVSGTGKKIEKYGQLELDIYEMYFENGNLVREVKINSANYYNFKSKDK